MRAIVTVVGRDRAGIIARVSGCLYEMQINIEDISQTLLQGAFTMVMLVDASASTLDFVTIAERLDTLGRELGMSIRIQREDIFEAMHRI